MRGQFGIRKKGGYRLGMSIDLLLLMLISTSMFGLIPFETFFQGNNSFTYYTLMMAYMYIKYMGFTFRSGILKHLMPLLLIVVGLLLSFVPAYVFFRQHLYHSLVVYRRTLCFLLFPLLLSISPTLKECRVAFYAYAILYTLYSFLGTYVYKEWVPVPAGMEYAVFTDLLRALPGIHFVGLALVFALGQYRETFRRKYLFLSIFLFAVIFMASNRTMILGSLAVVVAAVLFNMPARTRIVAEMLMIFFLAVLFVIGWDKIINLINETLMQLQDEDYNRVKAFNYFTSLKNGPLSLFLGNGFISGNVSTYMEDLRNEGIFNSDLGLIGLWHQFGLLFPLSVLYYELRGCSKYHSFHVRAMSVLMLSCSLTLAYYFNLGSIAWLCFFYYFAESDGAYFEALKARKEEIARQQIKKYRSVSG